MLTVNFITATGDKIAVKASVGETVMLAAMLGDVPGIEAECGGCISCGTCHVRVSGEWESETGEPNEFEKQMLEALEKADKRSRLSCQIELTDELDGLVVEVVES